MKQNPSLRKLLLLLSIVALVFAAAVPAFAQEEATPEAPAAEGEDHSEGAAVEGEEAAAEGEEAESPLDALGINAGFLIAQLVNFGIIFFLLTRFLWGPITNMLDSRSEKIRKGLEDAAIAANARLDAEAEAGRIKQSAQADVNKMIDEGRVRGEELAKEIEAAARSEAEKIRQDARTAAEAERNAQLADLRGQVAAISMAAAQRLIGASLDENRQRQLVDEFFTKVPADAKALSGAAEVISAMPLTEAEQDRVKGEISASDVTFRVDPSILGGLIIRSGDRVIDGSVRSGLNSLAARLN